MYLRLSWPGLIACFSIAPANVPDLAVVPELAAGTQGVGGPQLLVPAPG